MALKEILKKIPSIFQVANLRISDLGFMKKFSLLVYPIIILVAFSVYSITYNSINDKKNENERNLENFFSSKEFSNFKNSFFGNLKSPSAKEPLDKVQIRVTEILDRAAQRRKRRNQRDPWEMT